MKQNVYVMIDCVSGNHGDLFLMPNDASVIRSISGVMDKAKHADDFVYNMFRDAHIYCIGTFDNLACPMIEPCVPSRFVVSGASLISDEIGSRKSSSDDKVGDL